MPFRLSVRDDGQRLLLRTYLPEDAHHPFALRRARFTFHPTPAAPTFPRPSEWATEHHRLKRTISGSSRRRAVHLAVATRTNHALTEAQLQRVWDEKAAYACPAARLLGGLLLELSATSRRLRQPWEQAQWWRAFLCVTSDRAVSCPSSMPTSCRVEYACCLTSLLRMPDGAGAAMPCNRSLTPRAKPRDACRCAASSTHVGRGH